MRRWTPRCGSRTRGRCGCCVPGTGWDVLAAPVGTPADSARTIARNVRVAAVPEPASGPEAGSGGREGALVVLSVPRPTAARLAGAAAHSVWR